MDCIVALVKSSLQPRGYLLVQQLIHLLPMCDDGILIEKLYRENVIRERFVLLIHSFIKCYLL